jgi:hypothetical protein
MLRVPPALVGGIKAFKVFEDLAAPLKQLHADAIVRWAVIGSPAEFATSTRTHANIKIAGGFINPQFHERGRHDYCDFVMDTTAAMPKDFGGLSGGGLWRIVVYRSSQTGEIDWGKRLEGVVFFQFPQEKGSRRLRSHGPKSLTSLVGSANPQAIKELPGLQSFGGLNSEV